MAIIDVFELTLRFFQAAWYVVQIAVALTQLVDWFRRSFSRKK